MKSIQDGARAFLTRYGTDPRQYAINYRNALIFLVLDGTPRLYVPLAWALSAREPGWQHATRSMNSGKARVVAQNAGLTQIEVNDPRHAIFWRENLEECVAITSSQLAPHQRKFSEHHSHPREASDNSYYLLSPRGDDIGLSPDDAAAAPDFEGALKQITANRYERSSKLRSQCVEWHMTQNRGHLLCQVCGMDFARRYGPIGEGFIHIHHVDPLGNRQDEHLVDPKVDLKPVCPNCHAMLHKKPGRNAYSITELKKMMTNESG